MILAVLIGAGVMLIGVFAGFAISRAGRSKGPRGYEGVQGVKGPKGDMGLCQCSEGEKYLTEEVGP